MSDPSEALPLDLVEASVARDCPEWGVADGQLARTVRTSGWQASLLLTGVVGHLAELADHHPEIVVRFRSVTIRLTTHSAGGITRKDVALAALIDAVLSESASAEGGAWDGRAEATALPS